MTRWHTYVGNFTPEFRAQIDYIDTSRRALASLRPDTGKKDLRQVDPVARFSEGIEQHLFDDETGAIEHVASVPGLANPQYFARHPSLPVLYSIEWVREGSLLAFAVGGDGTLEQISRTATGGELSDAVAVHPGGKTAYVAHWGDGTVTACALDERGAVTSVAPILQGRSRGFFEREHFHDARVTADAGTLLLTDVGGDEVLGVRLSPEGRADAEPYLSIRFPQGSHPRNLEFHPSGRFAYVGGQWDSMVYVLSAEAGVPQRIIASASTRPPHFDGDNAKIAQLAVHPNGLSLYVTNRNSNSIAMFEIRDSGVLEPLGHYATRGEGPSTAEIDPSGRFLLVGSVFSGEIEVLAIDADGRLHAAGAPVAAHAPRAFAFFESR